MQASCFTHGWNQHWDLVSCLEIKTGLKKSNLLHLFLKNQSQYLYLKCSDYLIHLATSADFCLLYIPRSHKVHDFLCQCNIFLCHQPASYQKESTECPGSQEKCWIGPLLSGTVSRKSEYYFLISKSSLSTPRGTETSLCQGFRPLLLKAGGMTPPSITFFGLPGHWHSIVTVSHTLHNLAPCQNCGQPTHRGLGLHNMPNHPQNPPSCATPCCLTLCHLLTSPHPLFSLLSNGGSSMVQRPEPLPLKCPPSKQYLPAVLGPWVIQMSPRCSQAHFLC